MSLVPVIWLLISLLKTGVSLAPAMKFLTPTSSAVLPVHKDKCLMVTTPPVNVLPGKLSIIITNVFVHPPPNSLKMASVSHVRKDKSKMTSAMLVFVLLNNLIIMAPVKHVTAAKSLIKMPTLVFVLRNKSTTMEPVNHAQAGKSPPADSPLVFVPSDKLKTPVAFVC